MTPLERTTRERDRRFARARFITNAVLMGSLTTSVLFVEFLADRTHSAPAKASITVPATRLPATAPSVTTSRGDDFETDDSSSATPTPQPSTAYTTPTTAPAATPTVCTTTPSGQVTCH